MKETACNYSGKFVLRVPGNLHKRLVNIAKNSGKSLNQTCIDLLNLGLTGPTGESGLITTLGGVSQKVRDHFGSTLHGIILFGSYARNEATESSDIDLLIVLGRGVVIERTLYVWWDDNIKWTGEGVVNPHFVNLPDKPEGAGGLWLEVATNGKIIYQNGSLFNKLFLGLRECINSGQVRKHISNGHPYWVWRKDSYEK